jgi:hypothetical protein
MRHRYAYSVPFLFLLIVLTCSCSSVRLKGREEKPLDAEKLHELKGSYLNGRSDSLDFYNRQLFRQLGKDTTTRNDGCRVEILPQDANTLEVLLFDGDQLVADATVKGRFKRGYFRVRREWQVKGVAGPILWMMSENVKYIGLTNDNDLVVLHSGGSGMLFFLALPLFAAGGGQFENTYQRLE